MTPPGKSLRRGSVANAPHRFRGRRKELGASFPALLLFARQPQPSLMHERGGLQRLAGLLDGHLVRGEPPQLIINQREQFFGGVGITLLNTVEDARHVAHDQPAREIAVARSEYKLSAERGATKFLAAIPLLMRMVPVCSNWRVFRRNFQSQILLAKPESLGVVGEHFERTTASLAPDSRLCSGP